LRKKANIGCNKISPNNRRFMAIVFINIIIQQYFISIFAAIAAILGLKEHMTAIKEPQ